jgi:hypothetical protein
MMVLYGYWPQWYGTVRCYTAGGRIIISSASSDKECAVPIGLQSMRSFDMDIFRLHTGAPWPLCGLSMAISWLSWGGQVHSLLS